MCRRAPNRAWRCRRTACAGRSSNASPDLRGQLAAFPALHPKPGTRDVPLDTVALTSAELDHVLGLLVLREALSFRIVSTHWVRDAILEHNAAWRLLQPIWGSAALDAPVALDRRARSSCASFPWRRKCPAICATSRSRTPRRPPDCGITERATGARLAFVPGSQRSTPPRGRARGRRRALRRRTRSSRAGELRAMKPGAPDAAAMGHAPIAGADGSLAALADLPGRTYYVHMNCTNPCSTRRRPSARACGARAWRSPTTDWRSSCERDLVARGATARDRRRALSPPPSVQPAHARGHSSRATSSRAGSPTATTTRRASRSRTA
jgi:pyrroloquinoline quinone biosynthesis protein B